MQRRIRLAAYTRKSTPTIYTLSLEIFIDGIVQDHFIPMIILFGCPLLSPFAMPVYFALGVSWMSQNLPRSHISRNLSSQF